MKLIALSLILIGSAFCQAHPDFFSKYTDFPYEPNTYTDYYYGRDGPFNWFSSYNPISFSTYYRPFNNNLFSQIEDPFGFPFNYYNPYFTSGNAYPSYGYPQTYWSFRKSNKKLNTSILEKEIKTLNKSLFGNANFRVDKIKKMKVEKDNKRAEKMGKVLLYSELLKTYKEGMAKRYIASGDFTTQIDQASINALPNLNNKKK